jgi:hypothetical protein
MNNKRVISPVGLLASFLMTTAVLAQEVLPKPPEPFKGVIAQEPKDSKLGISRAAYCPQRRAERIAGSSG